MFVSGSDIGAYGGELDTFRKVQFFNRDSDCKKIVLVQIRYLQQIDHGRILIDQLHQTRIFLKTIGCSTTFQWEANL